MTTYRGGDRRQMQNTQKFYL